MSGEFDLLAKWAKEANRETDAEIRERHAQELEIAQDRHDALIASSADSLGLTEWQREEAIEFAFNEVTRLKHRDGPGVISYSRDWTRKDGTGCSRGWASTNY